VRRNPAISAAGVLLFLALGAAGFFAYQTHLAEVHAAAARLRHEDELRTLQRKSALERAVLAAMSGDFTGADRAVDDAVTHGASAAEVRFLRGQIALHRGQPAEAITNLEEATKLDPNWLAAQAVLIRALHDAGRIDEFYVRWDKRGDPDPQTAEDYLYWGQVTAYENPKKGLALLDHALELRDSVLARLIRAEARVLHTHNTGSTADAEAALADANRALAALPGNPVALAVSVEANLAATVAYRRHGGHDEANRAFLQAGRYAEDLKAHPKVPRAVRARVWFLDQADDFEGLKAEYLQNLAANEGRTAGRPYFLLLYRRGDFEEALKVLDRVPHTGNEIMYRVRRAFTLANLPDGPARARAEYPAALAAGKAGPPSGRAAYAHLIPLFLGRKEEAFEAYRKSAEQALKLPRPTLSSSRPSSWRLFRAGAYPAEKLLAEVGPSLLGQCEAHFEIGMQLLSGGDRAGARSHFEKSVNTGVFRFLEHEWSRAFLARMDDDAKWPRWIP
jgi:tetratricopeptide (TPR) repeat protein